jgi:hypothetical protein
MLASSIFQGVPHLCYMLLPERGGGLHVHWVLHVTVSSSAYGP